MCATCACVSHEPAFAQWRRRSRGTPRADLVERCLLEVLNKVGHVIVVVRAPPGGVRAAAPGICQVVGDLLQVVDVVRTKLVHNAGQKLGERLILVRARDHVGVRRDRRLHLRGFEKWITRPSDVNRFTSSIAGIFVTPSFLSVLPSFLSSDVAVLCTAFFFLRTEPLPPVRASVEPPKRRSIMRARAAAMASPSSPMAIALVDGEERAGRALLGAKSGRVPAPI